MTEEIEIDLGDKVYCDWCNTLFTRDDLTEGGMLFESKATCPKCMPRLLKSAEKYGETRFIRTRCPKGMTFHGFVMGLRKGDNSISF